MLKISQIIFIQLRYNDVTLEPEFLNFERAQESIPRNQFRQPM